MKYSLDPMSLAIWAVNSSMIELALVLYQRETYISHYLVFLCHEDD